MTTSGIHAAGSGRALSLPTVGRFIAVLFAALLISGCAQTKSQVATTGAPTPGSAPKVLMMKADVEVSILTAGGLAEPNAEWTQQAQAHLETSLTEVLGEKSVKIVAYEKLEEVGPEALAEAQIQKMHQAVGATILLHKYIAALELPTKKDKFDWTMGDSIAPLRDKYDADYVMFLHLRDSFSSAGRAALRLLVGGPSGRQIGYASLVDMETGDVVWFNFLHSTVGDLRKAEGSLVAVRQLLGDAPL